jgi:hypothetical protein
MTDDTFRVRCISFKIYSLIYFRTSRPLCTKSLQEFWCLHSDSIILRLPLPFLVRRGKMWTATVAHRLSEYSDSVVSSLVVTLLDYTLSKNVPACQQGLFALLVLSCRQVWCMLLSSCNLGEWGQQTRNKLLSYQQVSVTNRSPISSARNKLLIS